GEPVPKGGGRELVGRPYQIAGKIYVPRENISGYSRTGLASWYGAALHGRLTANGEVFDMHDITAAHTTMPLPSYARVTNLQNGNSWVVRVNDRGPYHGGRVIDVSRRAAELLDFEQQGVGKVKVEYLGPAKQTADSDSRVATLKTDGTKATLPAGLEGSGTMVAEAPTATPVPMARPTPILVAYQSEETSQAPLPAAWSRPVPATAPEQTALPPDRPFEFETIPNAATPVRAGAKPLQIPSATAVVPLPPARIPLPPQRNADAGDAAGGLLDGGTVRLRIADI